MKKAASPSTGGETAKGDMTNGSSESTLKGEAASTSSSSLSFSEELQGFTSASEVYSVRSLKGTLFSFGLYHNVVNS